MKLLVAGLVMFAAGVVLGTTKETVDVPFWEFVLAAVLIAAGVALAL